jgi:S-formylglutathione hydrolase FrmB
MKFWVLAVLAVGVLAGCASSGANSSQSTAKSSSRSVQAAATVHVSTPPAQPQSGEGLTVTGVQRTGDRLVDVAVTTDALAKPAHVAVLLPTGYNSATRYPVLYLLHGGQSSPYTGQEYKAWLTMGAEQLTADTKAIVVMPEGGAAGWYVNWYNDGKGGNPKWETFVIDQLVPWVDANFATEADRAHRAIAGASMGGFGAVSLAARHNDLFSTAASFSGALDITDPAQQTTINFVIGASGVFDGGSATSVLGSPQQNAAGWKAVDPASLVGNLKDVKLMLWYGQGTPQTKTSFDNGGIEAIVHDSNQQFLKIAHAAGLTPYVDAYEGGTHEDKYFAEDLKSALPMIMQAIGSSA